MNDPSTAKSRTGYVISYQGCTITWASKLETEVVLPTTESKYVGLSESLCIAIDLMNLLNLKEWCWSWLGCCSLWFRYLSRSSLEL
jgi:hypothetical protein